MFCSNLPPPRPSPLASPASPASPAVAGCTRARTLRTHASVMAARKYNDKRHRERASLHHRSAPAERRGRRTGYGGKEGSFFVSNEREPSSPTPSRRVPSRRVASRHTIAVVRLIASHCENNEITELSKYLEERIDSGRSFMYATRR